MQLDRTRIAIRERGILDLLDLSLQVTRAFWGPLLLIATICVIPAITLNHLLIGWMADIPYGEEMTEVEFLAMVRYTTDMTALMVIEAPLVTALIAAYLGKVVFLQKPSLVALTKECISMLPQLIVCQVLLRGIAIAWILLALVPRNSSYHFAEFLLLATAGTVMLLRTFRPFLIEIILLERNPIFGKKHVESMNISRRSQMLHGPNSGDVSMRAIVCALVAVMLFFSVWGTFIFIAGVLFNRWIPGPWMVQVRPSVYEPARARQNQDVVFPVPC